MYYLIEREESEKKSDVFKEQKATYELAHQHGGSKDVLHGLKRRSVGKCVVQTRFNVFYLLLLFFFPAYSHSFFLCFP